MTGFFHALSRFSSVIATLCLVPAAAAQSAAFTIAAWGDNSSGQLAVRAGTSPVAQVAAGDGHALALFADGTVAAWGRNDAGQTKVPFGPTGPRVFAIAAGSRHSLASTGAGLMSWGDVTAVPATTSVRAIAAGGDFNLAINASGAVLAAGGNAYGQTSVPKAAQAAVTAIAAGDGHALALKSDGSVVAWGKNDYGQATVPEAASRQVAAIAAGRDFSAALRVDGVIVVWGHGAESNLVPPPAATGARQIVAGADFIAVQTNASVVVWGQTGAPTQVPADLKATAALAAGSHFVLAVRAPSFTKVPGAVVARIGEAAELSAAVSDSTGITVNWTGVISQPNALSIPFPNVAAYQSGSYTVTVTYPTGYAMSATGTLAVLVPPTVRNQPAGIGAARENGSTTFYVTAEGSGPLTFQWCRDGVPVPGATSPIWTLQPVKAGDAGAYSCVVSGPGGQVTTSARTLLVLPPVTGREGRYTVALAGDRVVLRFDPVNQPAPYSDFSWSKDGVTIPGANGPELVISSFQASDAGYYRFSYTDGSGQKLVEYPAGALNLYRPFSRIYHAWLSPSEGKLTAGETLDLKLGGVEGYSGITYHWQISSAEPTWSAQGVDLTSVSYPVTGASARFFPSVWTNDISDAASGINGIFEVISGPWPAGTRTRYGGPGTMVEGESGEFLAEYAPPVDAVTWKKDGVVMPGQSGFRLPLNHVTPADAGDYEMTAQGAFGTRTSSWRLTVLEATRIVTQPQDASLDNGSAVLSVKLNTSSFYGYMATWFRDGQEFLTTVGTTDNPYGNSLTTNVPGTYTARVYADNGALVSAPAVVSASTSGGAVPVALQPGVYLHDRGAVYVRANRTAMVAAVADGAKLGWFGETTIDRSGGFTLPQALRVVSDQQPLAPDDRFPLSGQIYGEGAMLAYLGPSAGQTMQASLWRASNRKHEGFYRCKIPGGELWIFVTADDQVRAFGYDGYKFTSLFPLNFSGLTFSASGDTVTCGTYPNGPFLGLRESTARAAASLVNLSIRSLAGTGDRTLIAGLVLNGSRPRRVLLRAVGPGLVDKGVPNALATPALRIFNSDGRIVAENDGWGADAGVLSTAFDRLGAFPLKAGSHDAAALLTLPPGVYSAHVSVPNGASPGEALIETYDDGTDDSTSIVNLSSRLALGPGETAIQGFVVTGTEPKRLLIRAVGPGLAAMGLTEAIPNPRLKIVRDSAEVIANDDWCATPESTTTCATVAAQTGAFPLALGSRDAAVVYRFPPGVYSVHAFSGSAAEAGVVLIEIYDAP
ncbi:MAG: hypothetical protein JSS11_09585 [Verrucomicrobia bacterium]|nr:hypothetical protein [Verrucomicrobiota bacterium]